MKQNIKYLFILLTIFIFSSAFVINNDDKDENCEYSHFNIVYTMVLDFEGGYQNDKSDNGNLGMGKTYIGTNYGITPIAFKSMYGRWPTKKEMINLHVDTASSIAKRRFWNTIHGDSIKSLAIAYYTFDWFYGSWTNSIPRIKKAINKCYTKKVIIEDRTIDTLLIKYLNITDPRKLYKEMQKERIRHYKSIVNHNSEKSKFLNGWISRATKYTYDELYETNL